MTSSKDSCGTGDATFTWYALSDPADGELRALSDELGLDRHVAEHLREEPKRPFLATYDRVMVAVVKTAAWSEAGSTVRLGAVRLLIGADFVATVEAGADLVAGARRDFAAGGPYAHAGTAAVLPAVVDHAVRGFGPVIAELTGEVEDVEEDLFDETRSRPTARIYRLSRELLTLRRVMSPLTEMLERLPDPEGPDARRLRRRFTELRAHLMHLVESADALGNLLSNALQANLTEVSVRQNDDMREISALAAIWAIPTLFAGVWGMNFRDMPELGWPVGYPGALVIMVGVSYAAYRAFRRAGWL